jgi:DNA-binding SARP family transcriptional activator
MLSGGAVPNRTEPVAPRFRLLGPFEVTTMDGQVVPFSRRQERILLSILLLQPGAAVTTDHLCELLWDGSLPNQARQLMHTHMFRIRTALAAGDHGPTVVSHRYGYSVDVDRDAVDVHRFRVLLRRADATSDLGDREGLLSEALGLWRGPALHDASSALRAQLCADLDLLRAGAIEDRLEANLQLGRHWEVVPDLAPLTAEHPFNERLAGLYMRALHRMGRTVDALHVYGQLRRRLADEFGLDPGGELQRLFLSMVRGEPG